MRGKAAGAIDAMASKLGFGRESDPTSPAAHAEYHDLVAARRGHPDPIDLTDYALDSGRLAVPTAEAIKAHLETCDECRGEVAELQAHPEYYGAAAPACD